MKFTIGKEFKKTNIKENGNNQGIELDDITLKSSQKAPNSQVKAGSKDKSSKKEILFEEKDLRDAYSKKFKMSDGTTQSVKFKEPIHYFNADEGKYRGIDNTLELKDADATFQSAGYQTQYNDFTVRFSANVNSRSLMHLIKGNRSIEFRLLGIDDYEDTKKKKQTKLNHSSEVIHAAKINNGTKTNMEFAEKLSDEIFYKDIFSNTDLQYKMNGNSVKENFIIKERSDSYEFAFELRTKNLKIFLNENKQAIEFYEMNPSVYSKALFTIPAPIMFDASGAMSDRIWYDVEQIDSGVYIFKIVADEEWINSAERLFPVIVDPQIVVSGNEQNIPSTRGIDFDSPFLGLENIVGFEYDSSQDIFTSLKNAPQHALGYCDGYDHLADIFPLINISEKKFYFNYQNKTWRIQLWKGQYGPYSGCEIGVYLRDSIVPNNADLDNDSRMYRCAEEDEYLNMASILKDTNNNVLFTRTPEMHWWLTGFKATGFINPLGANELIMTGVIEFKDMAMKNAFCESNYNKTHYQIVKETSSVSPSGCNINRASPSGCNINNVSPSGCTPGAGSNNKKVRFAWHTSNNVVLYKE